jgi:hypothetical protein
MTQLKLCPPMCLSLWEAVPGFSRAGMEPPCPQRDTHELFRPLSRQRFLGNWGRKWKSRAS